MGKGSTACHWDIPQAMTMTTAGLVAILALTFYLRLLYFGQYIDADVGNAGYLAWRMAEGEVLIDLEGPGKPPLYFLLYAAFIRLFGASIPGIKIFGTFFVLMAVLAVYGLAKQAYGKGIGLWSALLFGIFSSAPMVEGGTVNLETVMHLPYILAVGLILKGSLSGQWQWYFLAGICAALAALVKQVGGVLFFVFLCFGIHEWPGKVHSFRKGWFFRYALVGGGALLVFMGLIGFYHFHGYTLQQLYDSLLGSNLGYIQRGYGSTNLLKKFLFTMKTILPENGLLWVGTLFVAAYLGRQILRGREKPGDRILLWWAFWSFAVLWLSGTFFQHYFLQIIAPFSILTAYGIVTAWNLGKSPSRLSRVGWQGGVMILVGIMLTIFIRTDYKYFFSYTPIEQTVFQRKVAKGVFDGYGAYNVVLHEIAYYIHTHTDPTDTLYVWGIAPQIYFLAQRKAATRYRNNYNLSRLVTSDPMKELQTYASTVIEEITRFHPAYIVQIFRLEHFPELQTLVRNEYFLEKDVGLSVPPYSIHLYRRRPDIPTLPSARGSGSMGSSFVYRLLP